METVEINGIKYQPVKPNGNRAVVVIDRGWIYAGDVQACRDSLQSNGLSNFSTPASRRGG